jgi:hypothetical protein
LKPWPGICARRVRQGLDAVGSAEIVVDVDDDGQSSLLGHDHDAVVT